MRPEKGLDEELLGWDHCMKIQMTPGLKERECEGCEEKPFCGFRSFSVQLRAGQLMQRVNHAGRLMEIKDVTGVLTGLSAWELREVLIFNRALEKAQTAKQDWERLLAKRAKGPSA